MKIVVNYVYIWFLIIILMKKYNIRIIFIIILVGIIGLIKFLQKGQIIEKKKC